METLAGGGGGGESEPEHLAVFRNATVRGATIAQLGTSIAMAGVMFGLILHFQYAYGWSPVRAGLANLPFILTMILATPIAEMLTQRFGHRVACLVGTCLALLVTSQLPAGQWSADLVASFFSGERVTYAVLAIVVGVVAGFGALTLSDSHAVEDN